MKCKSKTGNKDDKPFTAKNGKEMIKSKCVECGSGKCRIPKKK